MKVRGEVYSVSADGDELTIQVCGKQDGAPDWQEATHSTVRVANTARSRRSFSLGRRVVLTLEPCS